MIDYDDDILVVGCCDYVHLRLPVGDATDDDDR